LEERPRFALEPGCNDFLDSGDFGVVNRHRSPSSTHYEEHAGRRKNREPILHIESAEQIAREKRKFHFLKAIRPSPSALIQRQKGLVAFAVH
jgi:hypothetical protein